MNFAERMKQTPTENEQEERLKKFNEAKEKERLIAKKQYQKIKNRDGWGNKELEKRQIELKQKLK